MSVDNTMKQAKEIDRGISAKSIIDNPLFQEAFDTIRQNMLDQFEGSPADDAEGREQAWKMLKAVGTVREYFITIMKTGQMAEITRQEEMKKAEAKKRGK